ncbi:hypothetical protein UlMin_036532 [Ulmus minor]
MESKDLGRLVAFLAKMIVQRPLAAQLVSKGLVDLNRWRRLLDKSSPREVTMDALMIVLDLARMDKLDVTINKAVIPHLVHNHYHLVHNLSFSLCTKKGGGGSLLSSNSTFLWFIFVVLFSKVLICLKWK